MASNTGAYFEGMKYANQGVQPVNFGEIATGFAKIIEDKRLEAKKDKERREATQMEMSKLYGEEIYSAFDGTGLKDVDVVTGKIKDSIVARANVLNSMFEKGTLTAPQMMQEMQKLNAQSKKIASFASSSADSFTKIQENANSSAATEFLAQRANQLFQEATPIMDANGKISFLSKDGDVMTNNPVDEMERLLQNRDKVDVDGIAKNIIETRGQLQKTYQDGKVIESKGSVGESEKTYISNLVDSMDAEDIFDIADQAGVKVDMDPNSVFKIANEDEVKEGVKKYLEEYTQESFNAQTKIDEVAGKNMSLALQREYRAAEEYKKANEGAVVNVIAGEDEKERIEVYPPAGKKIMVESLVTKGQSFSKGSIGNYTVDEDGNHTASISYTSTIDVPAEVGKGTEKKTVTITEDVKLDTPAAINQVRTQFGMEPIKDVPLQDTEKKRKAYK
jgi:hypothetical protein